MPVPHKSWEIKVLWYSASPPFKKICFFKNQLPNSKLSGWWGDLLIAICSCGGCPDIQDGDALSLRWCHPFPDLTHDEANTYSSLQSSYFPIPVQEHFWPVIKESVLLHPSLHFYLRPGLPPSADFLLADRRVSLSVTSSTLTNNQILKHDYTWPDPIPLPFLSLFFYSPLFPQP